MEFLDNEEKALEKIVERLGSISVSQAPYIYPNLSQKRRDYVLSKLVRERRVFYSKKKDYFIQNPAIKPDSRVKDALWAAIEHAGRELKPFTFYKAQTPSTIGYMLKNRCYEVVAGNADTEVLWAADEIAKEYEKNSHEEGEMAITYIFVVKSKETIKAMPEFPYPHVIAYETYMDGTTIKAIPDISFFSREE